MPNIIKKRNKIKFIVNIKILQREIKKEYENKFSIKF
jgi:hypothetical protein